MDEAQSKFVTDEFILSGTLNLRSFVSPIKKFYGKENPKTPSVSNAGILSTSSPLRIKNRAASTPAYEQKKLEISFGISNKDNLIAVQQKKTFDFLKEINEVDESVINTQEVAEAIFDPKVISTQINEVEPRPAEVCENEKSKIVIVAETVEPQVIPDTQRLDSTQIEVADDKIGYELINFEIKVEDIQDAYKSHSPEDLLRLSSVSDSNPKFGLEKFIEKSAAKNNDNNKTKINALKNDEKKQHTSLPLSPKNKARKSTSQKQKRSSLNPDRHPINKPDEDPDVRRSKRVRLDHNERGIYEFETITDFQGKTVVVERLVGTQTRRISLPVQLKLKSPKKEPVAKTAVRSEKIEKVVKTVHKGNGDQGMPKIKNEKLLIRGNEVVVYSFNQNLESKKFSVVSEGVTVCMDADDEGGILCIEPFAKCRTQRHTSDIIYMVREGKCSFLINEIETILEKGEVAKIPHSVKYKVGNVLNGKNSYVNFQFL